MSDREIADAIHKAIDKLVSSEMPDPRKRKTINRMALEATVKWLQNWTKSVIT